MGVCKKIARRSVSPPAWLVVRSLNARGAVRAVLSCMLTLLAWPLCAQTIYLHASAGQEFGALVRPAESFDSTASTWPSAPEPASLAAVPSTPWEYRERKAARAGSHSDQAFYEQSVPLEHAQYMAEQSQLVQYEQLGPPSTIREEIYEDAYPNTAATQYSDCEESGEFCSQILPQGLIYRAYLANEKESRFRSLWSYEQDLGWKWDLTLGGRVGLYRYGSTGDARPVGFQIDLEGAGLVRLDPEENSDVDSADFRGGFPITWGTETHQVKFAYYHLSSHLGDEFLLKNPGYNRLNFSRDVLVLGHSYYMNPEWRLYGEVGYAFYSDITLEWEFQFGVEYAPAVATGWRGAPFFAVNAHLREEVNFGGNLVVQAGWAWRRSPSSGLFRVGAQYFNGESDQFSFYDDSENKYGFGIWYDY